MPQKAWNSRYDHYPEITLLPFGAFGTLIHIDKERNIFVSSVRIYLRTRLLLKYRDSDCTFGLQEDGCPEGGS